MKIAAVGQAGDVKVIHELLSPWNVSFTGIDEAEIAIFYKEKPLKAKRTIVIPSDSSDFMTWVKDMKPKVMKKLGERVFVAISSQTALAITPQALYCYDGLVESARGEIASTEIELDGNLVVLALDVVKEYNEILDETLNAKQSTLYRMFTGLPISYGIAPKRLRDLIIRVNGGQEISTFCNRLPIDALRFILVRAIEKLADRKLDKKLWNGKEYAIMLTHDVDTRRGLLRAKKLKTLENKYDVPSAWYIPSELYKLDTEVIRELANHGEVGAHDTKHDGKLDNLSESKLIERLRKAREELQRILGDGVKGFRAPLLQHSVKIIRASGKAGYLYDTSIPTWEPRHPKTMKPHGIATVYPLVIEGVTEIPVTLPQDHQLLHILGLSPKELMREWTKIIGVIKEIGGLCTVLVHPDYDLAYPENLGIYEDLLNTIASDREALVSLPGNVTTQVKLFEA